MNTRGRLVRTGAIGVLLLLGGCQILPSLDALLPWSTEVTEERQCGAAITTGCDVGVAYVLGDRERRNSPDSPSMQAETGRALHEGSGERGVDLPPPSRALVERMERFHSALRRVQDGADSLAERITSHATSVR
jgi:hypothetical protein